MSKTEIKISVREMIEFLHRGGDLDSRFMGRSRAHEGTKAHQKIQNEQMLLNATYESEITLSHHTERDNFTISVSGRADGIFEDEADNKVIDEIKSTLKELEDIDEDSNPLHWMQGKCYAYFYALNNDLDTIKVQLTYVKLKSYDTLRFVRDYTFDELKDFYENLIDQYAVWAQKSDDWKQTRDTSIKALAFPFDSYREGQHIMAKGVYKSIKDKNKIFIQAPTGIGKTISTLFPAIKALGEDKTDKVLYLTAKTITRSVAEDTVKLMLDKGLRLRTVTVTAKDKICFEKDAACTPEECSFAKGHFNRVNEAIDDILSHEDLLTRTTIEIYAHKHHVCPFEFSLDLAMFADCSIMDYNYVFDPRVYMKRFFDISFSRYSFLIDEVHNLVDRSRSMFSAEIYKQDFLDSKRLIKGQNKQLEKALDQVNKFLLTMKKDAIESNKFVYAEAPTDLYPLLRKFSELAEKWLTINHGAKGHAELLDLFFSTSAFIKISELYDDMYVTYMEVKGNNLKVKLFCAEPSRLIREALKRGISACLFSATLMPMDYFKRFYAFDDDDYTLMLRSPFDPSNREFIIGNDIATTYKKREQDYGRIASYLKELIKGKQGNYIAFFSSYKYLNEVKERLENLELETSNIKLLVQERELDEEGRELFLETFQESPSESMLALCVLGGIFSEGIDLRHDRLIGAAIVGVGLPMVCMERELIKEHHISHDEDGFMYAYVYPGINKVLQAAGRVIRTEEDKGVILLLDERYGYSTYRNLIPNYWAPQYVRQNNFSTQLKSAWTKVLDQTSNESK